MADVNLNMKFPLPKGCWMSPKIHRHDLYTMYLDNYYHAFQNIHFQIFQHTLSLWAICPPSLPVKVLKKLISTSSVFFLPFSVTTFSPPIADPLGHFGTPFAARLVTQVHWNHLFRRIMKKAWIELWQGKLIAAPKQRGPTKCDQIACNGT